MKSINRKQLLAKLVLKELLTSATAQSIERELPEQESLVQHLIHYHSVSAKQLAQLLSQETQLPICQLQNINRQQLPLNLIENTLQERFMVLPLKLNQQYLDVALADPTFEQLIPTLSKITRKVVKIFIAPHDELQQLLQKTTSISTDEIDVVPFINEIIETAIAKNASDIHFEPYEQQYRVRFRIDGVLHTMFVPDSTLAMRITTCVKIMANLDIAEKRLPQDGRFKKTFAANQAIDFRVSTCPTLFGEKIVLRLLDTQQNEFCIENLGFSAEQQQLFQHEIQKNQGLILVTGPTGSGKTMTLYSALHQLNTEDKNISSVEDPVEIYLPGINQVHINNKIGLDFAHTLRTFLRQDPDIIMLGEIRDPETAEVALKAAQTGHLVLATLHTNSAVETLTRLQNLGIAHYQISNSVNLIIAQRLVRCLCTHCKTATELTSAQAVAYNVPELKNTLIYEARGCSLCVGGYQGRIGIFEVLPITEQLQSLILEQQSTLSINTAAKAANMMSLRAAGIEKIRQGITSLTELQRVL